MLKSGSNSLSSGFDSSVLVIASINPFSTVSSIILDISSSISNLSNQVLVFLVSGFFSNPLKTSTPCLNSPIPGIVAFKSSTAASSAMSVAFPFIPPLIALTF